MADEKIWHELLGKARDGELSAHELDQVAAAIKDPDVIGDRYTLLHIIGLSMATPYEDLVSSYLNSADDAMMARLGLQILCSFWGKTPEYLGYVWKFLRGVDWDDEDDVRQIAISIAGEHVRKTWDEELFRKLLDIATNEGDVPAIRLSAIDALARALGDEWTEIPPVSTRSDPDDGWHREALERAFQRFVEKK